MELTPLGNGWTWRDRAAELILQPLALVVLGPVVLLHRGTGWVLEKIFNS